MNCLRQPIKACFSFGMPKVPFLKVPFMPFSEYFRIKDQQQIWAYEDRKVMNKKYRALVDQWKRPLEKKKLRQARIREIKANLKTPEPENEKMIVHNTALGIQLPPNPQNIFAVIKVDSRQFKVTNDCIILLDTKPEHQINRKIVFDEVLLAGTDTFTLLGRPNVGTVKVEGIIESISMSDKVLVFKKKRRKQYKKSFGSRVSLTSCRITAIQCQVGNEILEKAVPL